MAFAQNVCIGSLVAVGLGLLAFILGMRWIAFGLLGGGVLAFVVCLSL